MLYSEGGSAATAGAPGTASGETVSTSSVAPGSRLVVNIAWDASVANAPAAFKAAVLAAAQYLGSQFTDAVTVNLSVGFGEVAGSPIGSGALGQNMSFLSNYSYASLRSALASDSTSGDDQSVLSSLPPVAPVSGNFWATTAQSKALGLADPNGTATDAYIGFSSSAPFTYDTSSGVASGTYDFGGVALHEMTEVLGRMLLTGASVGSFPRGYTILDLLHYAGPGTRDFSSSLPGYFSLDGGRSDLGDFNTVSSGDAGDWSSSAGYDSFNAFLASGVINPVTVNDLREMDALGWNRTGVRSALPANHAPVVAGRDVSVAANQSVSGAALIASMTDGDGDPISYFAFLDGGAGGGYLTLNGVAQPAGQWIGTPDPGAIRYVGGSAPGSETISLAAYDGKDWSAVAGTLTATTVANHAPVLTGRDVSVAADQSVSGAALIASVADGDGDPISYYAFLDGGAGGGYLTLNGVAQPAGQWVGTPDPAAIRYVGGSVPGTETISLAAYDGKEWSAVAGTLTATTVASHGPVLTGRDVSVAASQSVSGAALIASMIDPNGDPISYYAFLDGGAGGGYLTLNGVAQPAGQWIGTPDPAAIRYVGGSAPGSETISLAAYDGKDWSAAAGMAKATTTA